MENNEKEDKKDELNKVNAGESGFVTYFWIGVAASVIALTLFLLTVFLPTVFGVYGLIAAVLCSLASLAFLNSQKKKNNFKAVLFVTIAAYVLLAALIAFFIGGIIYASSGK